MRIGWLVLVGMVLLSGCGKSAPAVGGAGNGSAALEEVRLGYFGNVTHAQAVLGVASGDFQAALGTTRLKTRVFNAGPELIQALNGGALDIGYVGPGPVIAADANSGGQAVRVVAGAAANGVAIVARKDSGISSLKDLYGKRVATPQLGNTQDIAARHYLTAVLGEPNADNVLPVPNSQQAGMMIRGQIDAAWSPEPWASRLVYEAGGVVIGEEKDLWPGHRFSLTVIVTTPRFLAEHADIVRKILDVHHAWTVKLQNNPSAYADQLDEALAALNGKALPDSVLRGALARTEFTDDPLPQTFSTMAQWSQDLGFIHRAPELSTLFQTDIISSISSPTPTPATRP